MTAAVHLTGAAGTGQHLINSSSMTQTTAPATTPTPTTTPSGTPEPREVKFEEVFILINGEIVLRSDVNPTGLFNMRGRINLPAGYRIEHFGLPPDFEEALSKKGFYQFKLSGPLNSPELEAL
jgi:hypothetical protein